MPDDLSSVARKAAHELERQLPGGSYADGWADCASRLPSEDDIEIAILGRTATQAAKAVHALIERGIRGPGVQELAEGESGG